MKPILIGYFPKAYGAKPDWLNRPDILEICSVSECVSAGPKDWINKWKHNEMWVYDDERVFDEIIPEGRRSEYMTYAYRMYPCLIHHGEQSSFAFPEIHPTSLGDTFVSLGYDIVSRSCGTSFECSPLSCNHVSESIHTNQYCLLDSAEEAFKHALTFDGQGCEPGPYAIIEVLRKMGK